MKANVTIETLDAFVAQYNENEAADRLRSAWKKLFFQSTNCNGLKLKGKRAQIYSPYFFNSQTDLACSMFFLGIELFLLKRLSLRLISKLENTLMTNAESRKAELSHRREDRKTAQKIVEEYLNRFGMNLKIVEVVGERFCGDLLQSFEERFGCQLAVLPVVNLPDCVRNECHEENSNCELIHKAVRS